MKLGVNTLIWTGGFEPRHISLFPALREGGFDGVEIARFSFEGFPAEQIGKAARGQDLECIFCSALTGSTSLVSEDAAVRKQALTFLKDGIRTASELGAALFIGPFLAPVGYLPGRRRTADEWKRGVEGLQQLSEALDSHNITLAIEPLNRFETYFLNTVADAVALCEEVNHPRVGVLFDTFHANIEEKNIADAVRKLGRHLKHVHTCENDRGIPGTGNVQWDGLFTALSELDYKEWLVIESFGFTIKEIAAAACIWRDVAPSPEAIAFEGIEFLKRRTGRSSAAA
jgi:D-psicose/D-tagatose/L-ribulose 3-epimerase